MGLIALLCDCQPSCTSICHLEYSWSITIILTLPLLLYPYSTSSKLCLIHLLLKSATWTIDQKGWRYTGPVVIIKFASALAPSHWHWTCPASDHLGNWTSCFLLNCDWNMWFYWDCNRDMSFASQKQYTIITPYIWKEHQNHMIYPFFPATLHP